MQITEKGSAADDVNIGAFVGVQDKINWKATWRIEKYENDEALREGRPYEVKEIPGNLLLNEGITEMLNLLIGATATAFNNANSYIGVGDSTNAAAATQARLQAVESKTAWAASTAYSLGNIVRPTSITDASRFYYECTTAGTSGTTEPTWPTTNGATVADGTVVWTARERIVFKAMDAGYPQVSAQTVTWRATYGAGEAAYTWNEFTVANGNGATVKNLNRKVDTSIGTKGSSPTWVISLAVTIS